MIWPIDDPTYTHPSERPEDDFDADLYWAVDDIERADIEAATRADERLDEDDTDYDGPEWPF